LNARRSTIAPGHDLYWFLTDAPAVLIRPPPRSRYATDSAVHPYRELPADREAPSAPREELILYVLLCAVGAIPVAAALLRGGAFGVEATVGLAMALAGLVGLVGSARAGRRRCTR
jgi:hypothetical protein